jgi:hypothetical protein
VLTALVVLAPADPTSPDTFISDEIDTFSAHANPTGWPSWIADNQCEVRNVA